MPRRHRATGPFYDLIVVGLGSAGIIAAELAARDLGLRVAAVERGRVGGDCLWGGCVPSKALRASAEVAHTARRAEHFGVGVGEVTVDRRAVWARIHRLQDEIATTDDDPDHLRSLGVDLIVGEARMTGAREVTVRTTEGERVLRSTFVLICTGSRARMPEISGLDGALTTDTLFALDEPPESLVIIGGGPTGVETAQATARLGIPTTLFEAGPRLLPREEPELSDRLTTVLRADGVSVHLAAPVDEVVRTHRSGESMPGGPTPDGSMPGESMPGGPVEVRAGTITARAAEVLVAVGRRPNIDGLGLERLGIPVGDDGVEVDGRSRTLVPSIYVVGDAAAGRVHVTHAAAHDGAIAVRDMFFPGRGLAAGLVPWCTFTDPELAHVGLTAAEARRVHGDRAVEVHRRDLDRTDRARVDGDTEGTMLLVTAKRRLVGAHLLAPAAGEIVQELALAIRLGLDLADLSRLPHVYPTISTGLQQVAAEQSVRSARRFRRLARVSRHLG